jgi:hypothetical protein
MGTYCLERFNQNGDLVSRKCVTGPSFKSSVERDHPGFVVTEIGSRDDLCEHCPVYPSALGGLSEQDVKDILRRFAHEVLEEIRRSRTGW